MQDRGARWAQRCSRNFCASLLDCIIPDECKIMNKVTVGWTIEIAGTALWLFGYFRPGTASLVDWKTLTPWWIAEWLPSLQAEVGMALIFIGMFVIYWPARARK